MGPPLQMIHMFFIFVYSKLLYSKSQQCFHVERCALLARLPVHRFGRSEPDAAVARGVAEAAMAAEMEILGDGEGFAAPFGHGRNI